MQIKRQPEKLFRVRRLQAAGMAFVACKSLEIIWLRDNINDRTRRPHYELKVERRESGNVESIALEWHQQTCY